MNKVLLIEDDRDISNIEKDYLECEGFEVIQAFDGEEGINYFKEMDFSVIVLDIMLPKIQGTDVCKVIRKDSTVPIIMLSAKTQDIDKVLSLGLGADDYMTKPFSPIELVARVKVQVRRYEEIKELYELRHMNLPKEVDNKIVVGKLEISKELHLITVKGKEINVTSREFDILEYLAKNERQVFSKEQIYNNIWGYDGYGDINAVTVYIKRLREKLKEAGVDYIKTVWGVGYKLDGKDEK